MSALTRVGPATLTDYGLLQFGDWTRRHCADPQFESEPLPLGARTQPGHQGHGGRDHDPGPSAPGESRFADLIMTFDVDDGRSG